MRGTVAKILTLWVHTAPCTSWWRTPNTLAHHGDQGCSGPGTRPKGTPTRAPGPGLGLCMPAKACVRSVPNPKSGRYEACSGPTSMWPRSLCPQGALDGSVRQLGALKIGPSLGATFGLQDPASSSDCSVSPQPLGRPSPWLDRLRGGARGRLARGGSSPESGEVSRGRCGLLRCPAVRARGPRLPSLRAEQAANAESRAQQLSRSRAGTMGGESGAGQAQAGCRWG